MGYAYGPDIAPDGDNPKRSDYRHQFVLHGRLLAAMQEINPTIPVGKLEEVATAIAKPEFPALNKSNRTFHNRLLEGVKVSWNDGGEERHDHAQLIDFNNVDNNQFLVVNQFTVQGTKMNRRPDVVAFINGLPIAVLELKNPADENADIWDAYNQLQAYKDEIPDLFVFNEALVVSDGVTARLGSLNRPEFFGDSFVSNQDDHQFPQNSRKAVERIFWNDVTN